MSEILFPVLVVSGIGLAAGLILSIASSIMSVKKNEKLDLILNILPGANCGACGFSGCEGYAKALSEGTCKPGLCTPGGKSTADKISEILGIASVNSEKKVALVHCSGSIDNTSKKMEYNGIKSCTAASSLFGGDSSCQFGCLGLGDCIKACKYGAIDICSGVSLVDYNKCVGCGACVKACPKNLINLVPAKQQAVVRCSNLDKGAQTIKVCSSGCIGCMRCAKTCKFGAITVENSLAKVDPKKCTGCGNCVKVCKPGCISLMLD